MFGSVLATVNESLTTVRPATHASWIFHRKPVIRLTSVAIAIEPLALASDGCRGFGCCDLTSTPLRVKNLLARLRPGLLRPRRPHSPEDPEADQQHEHRTGGAGDSHADEAV